MQLIIREMATSDLAHGFLESLKSLAGSDAVGLLARADIDPTLRAEEIGIEGFAALARALNVPTNRITGILNGQRAITADTALRLGHWFGTSAEFWLNLQKSYELRLAENEKGAEIRKLPKRKAA